MMLTRTRRNQDGFSLIELLVVVIIIGILAAIAVPIYIGVQNSARDSAVKSDLVNAKTFMVAEYTKNGAYPTNLSQLKAVGFTQSASSTSDYTINFEFFNVTGNGFCLRGWADIPGQTRDLWVTGATGVIGPIPVTDYANRPAGCPTS